MSFIFPEKRSPEDNRDWIAESIQTANRNVRSGRDVVSLPEVLDLRPYLPLPRNQGSRGTCAAFSSSAIKEYQEFKDYGFAGNMSPEYIYYFRENKPDEGMYGRDVMKILTQYGACTEALLPYHDKDVETIPDELIEKGRKHVIKNYAQVTTLEGLKQALYDNGPCYISFPVYENRPEVWRAKVGEISRGGHAMVVVGYNTKGFIIRNSWGSGWNGNGYVIYPYEEFGVHWEIWTLIDAETLTDDGDVEDEEYRRRIVWYRRLMLCLRPGN